MAIRVCLEGARPRVRLGQFVLFFRSRRLQLFWSQKKCIALRAPMRAQVQHPAHGFHGQPRALYAIHVRVLAHGTTPRSADSLEHHRYLPRIALALSPYVLNMHVRPGVHVVKQIPADVIGVLVNHEVIPAVPAPIRADGPIPGGHFEPESSGKPKPMVVRVKALHVVAVTGAKTLELSVLGPMIDVEALVIRRVVAVPMVVADVLRAIPLSVHVPLDFYLRMGVSFWRRRRNPSLVGSRRIGWPRLARMPRLPVLLARMLRHHRHGERQKQS